MVNTTDTPTAIVGHCSGDCVVVVDILVCFGRRVVLGISELQNGRATVRNPSPKSTDQLLAASLPATACPDSVQKNSTC